MIGKVPRVDLESHVFTRTGATDTAVSIGPQFGEDAAAICLGDQFLVLSSDPISLAAERIGTIAVHVACNDIAASGADPRWLTNVLFLPGADGDLLDGITAQIDAAARSIGVTIVGGHSEYVPSLARPMASLTCVGLTPEFIPTSGASPGDRVLLTKGAGIEGTAIIATDFRADLTGTIPDDDIDRAAGFFEEISVLEDSRIARQYATAMHDPTEGGVIEGLFELAAASTVELTVRRDDIPVREVTRRVCAVLGVDPLRIFGSGGLLFTVPADSVDTVLAAFESSEIPAADIGTVREAPEARVIIDETVVREPIRDDLYPFWE